MTAKRHARCAFLITMTLAVAWPGASAAQDPCYVPNVCGGCSTYMNDDHWPYGYHHIFEFFVDDCYFCDCHYLLEHSGTCSNHHWNCAGGENADQLLLLAVQDGNAAAVAEAAAFARRAVREADTMRLYLRPCGREADVVVRVPLSFLQLGALILQESGFRRDDDAPDLLWPFL
jgi:hypothetical protein